MTSTQHAPRPAVAAAGVDAYDAKPDVYFAGVRSDFLQLLKQHAPADARVLEVGCGFGETGREALQQHLAGEYFGCELDRDAAATAATYLTQVLAGDIETLDLPWPDASLDAVLISEVLEHLHDPWAVVRRLAGLLKPGGVILASSPNVSHYRIIAQLLRGRFEYADVGPMDRTHLRWFTPVSYAQMFEDAGFATRHVGPMTPAGRKTKLLRAASLGLLPASLFMRQVKYIGQKPRGQ